MTEEVFVTHSAGETEAIGAALARRITSGIIALYGDLGSGKTVFCRGFVRALFPNASVKSPTYTVVSSYGAGDREVYHLDLYRITDEDDLYSVGFFDLPEEVPVLCEWAQKLPEDTRVRCKVTIAPGKEEDTREIRIEEMAAC